MIIGNNIPTGVEKVTIDGEKVREKISLNSCLEYQIFHIENKSVNNPVPSDFLYTVFPAEDDVIGVYADGQYGFMVQIADESYYGYNLSTMQNESLSFLLNKKSDKSFITFNEDNSNLNYNFNFNDFSFEINSRKIQINGINYYNQFLLGMINYSDEGRDSVIYKSRVYSKGFEDKILIMHIATKHNRNYMDNKMYSHDIIVFYPVYKAIQ